MMRFGSANACWVYCKGDVMLGLILAVLSIVPFKVNHAHFQYIIYMALLPYINMATSCSRAS